MNKSIKNFFVKNILQYYKQHKRDLPWRNTDDPYKIWISEIILQQTQVKQGLNYYLKFIQKFPNAQSLANAKEDEVLHLWQGLGYYSRARNLHYAAKQIVDNFEGKFPDHYNDILKLKGIGEYTAAAIASFAYNQPYAVLDGNVFRVLSRFFGINTPIDTNEGKKQFKELAQSLLPSENPSEYNQAMMEFGATYCKPQSPNCNHCVLNKHCTAFLENKVNDLPVKSKKIDKKNRYFNYFIFIENHQYTYITKRQNQDIWQSLYEFYLIDHHKKFLSLKEITHYLTKNNIHPESIKIISRQKHILTHQNLHIQFVRINIPHPLPFSNLKKIKLKDLPQYPFPVMIQKLINRKEEEY